MSRYAKPDGFSGRGKGNRSYKRNKWYGIVYENGEFRSGKYPTKDALIEGLGLSINRDHIYRLVSGQYDKDKSKKDSSFLAKYSHIKIEKIDEPSGQSKISKNTQAEEHS